VVHGALETSDLFHQFFFFSRLGLELLLKPLLPLLLSFPAGSLLQKARQLSR
jgi:hypothetical protein